MIRLKNREEIAILREGGRRLAEILAKVSAAVSPDVSGEALNALAEKLIRERGDTPTFLGYKPRGASRPFPAALCVSVDDEIVHGVPNERPKILREGALVSVDCAITHRGLVTDMAVTVPVGKVDAKGAALLRVTEAALTRGIAAARVGATLGDVGSAIEKTVAPHGFGIVRDLSGHGVGYALHEDPFVPNYGKRGGGLRLEEGFVLAIEPMLTLGSEKIILDTDGYTVRTSDGSRAAHFEHTVAVTSEGPLILTAP